MTVKIGQHGRIAPHLETIKSGLDLIYENEPNAELVSKKLGENKNHCDELLEVLEYEFKSSKTKKYGRHPHTY